MSIEKLLEILKERRIDFEQRKAYTKEGYTITILPNKRHDFYVACAYITDWAYENNAKTYVNEDYQYFEISFENIYHNIGVKILKYTLLGA